MTLVYVLLVAHFMADFIAQSDWMALNKSKRWDALGLHAVAYSIVLAAFVVIWAAWTDPLRLAWPVGVFLWWNSVAHFVQDAITSRINARLFPWRLVTTPDLPPIDARSASIGWYANRGFLVPSETGNRHWFFVAIGFDQLLHYVTLFVTADWWLM